MGFKNHRKLKWPFKTIKKISTSLPKTRLDTIHNGENTTGQSMHTLKFQLSK